MNIHDLKEKRSLTAKDAALILSETLQDVVGRRTSIRRALVISRLALALSKVIEINELKERVEFLEQSLKKRK